MKLIDALVTIDEDKKPNAYLLYLSVYHVQVIYLNNLQNK